MAGRHPKDGIDYAGWDVNIFDGDSKIDRLMDAQGCVGFTIYFYLCQKAYGSNGYFYLWSFDDAATTARKIGGGAGSESVKQTVSLCLQIGLLDKRLFEGHGILTSRGIQKRYRQVALTRTNKSVIKEYWLLSASESTGLDFYTLNLNYDAPKLNYDAPKLNYDTQKYSKVKESKVKDRSFAAPAAAEVREYNEALNTKTDNEPIVFDYEYFVDYWEARGWEVKKGMKMRDWKAAVRTWRKNEKPAPEKIPYRRFDDYD